MEKRDKNIFGHPQKSNTSMVWVLVSGFGGPKGPGSRFGTGPCQTNIFISKADIFFLGGLEILNFRGSGF